MSHNRTFSVMSTGADSELCAVADLMSPVVDVSSQFAEHQEQLEAALDDEFDAFIEPSLHYGMDSSMRTSRANSHSDSGPDSSLYPPPSPSSNRNSMYSDSEFDHPSDTEIVYPPKPSAYPAFHLPRPRLRHVSNRDSDTPSLTSSTSYSSLGSVSRSQSRRNSPPISPASLMTPIEYHSNSSPHLAIIEERYIEDQDFPHRVSADSSRSDNGIMFAVPDVSPTPSAKTEDTFRDLDRSTVKKRMPHLEHLRLNASTPRRSRSQSPSLRSPVHSSDSGTIAPQPSTAPLTTHRGGSAVSFTRILGGGSKSGKQAAKAAENDVWSVSTQSPTQSFFPGSKQEEKRRKAEEKQRKKDEAKAKTERLAQELKAKAKQRAAAQDKGSIHSSRSGEKKPTWDEGPALFGGLYI